MSSTIHTLSFLGWLVPLLDVVHKNKTTVVSPVIESVDQDSLRYNGGWNVYVGGFKWDLTFFWYLPTPTEKGRRTRFPHVGAVTYR